MGLGLTFEEYAELRLKPRVDADRVFHQAADDQREEMFQMKTGEASHHLRSRGYDCKPIMLELLIRNGVVTLAEPDHWTQADVEVAVEHFEDCSIFVPYAAMCQALGCRYSDFLTPLREAAERESQKYGRNVPEDDQYFVMHRTPPHGVTDDNGNFAEITSSVISFTLCDDIRERLECGEEV